MKLDELRPFEQEVRAAIALSALKYSVSCGDAATVLVLLAQQLREMETQVEKDLAHKLVKKEDG